MDLAEWKFALRSLLARTIDTRRSLLKDTRDKIPGREIEKGRELDSPAESYYGVGAHDCPIQNSARGRMDSAWEQLQGARCACRFRYCGVNSARDLAHVMAFCINAIRYAIRVYF